MITEHNNLAFYSEKKDSFNFKKIFLRFARKWKLFTFFIFLGLLLAWSYNHYTSPEYSIHSSLVINEYQIGIKQFNLTQGAANNENLGILQQDHPGR
jgi:uncharacterized protein involved in exopolysaccharide biosynthesis